MIVGSEDITLAIVNSAIPHRSDFTMNSASIDDIVLRSHAEVVLSRHCDWADCDVKPGDIGDMTAPVSVPFLLHLIAP